MALEEVTGNPRAPPPSAVVKPTSRAIVARCSGGKILPAAARLIKAITLLLHAGQLAPSTRRRDPLHSSHVE